MVLQAPLLAIRFDSVAGCVTFLAHNARVRLPPHPVMRARTPLSYHNPYRIIGKGNDYYIHLSIFAMY